MSNMDERAAAAWLSWNATILESARTGVKISAIDTMILALKAADAVPFSDDQIEAVAKAWHDTEIYPGSWESYDTWTVNTDDVHATYRVRARAALKAVFG